MILACDIGFGYTKYVFAEISENTAKVIKKGKFPSAVRVISFLRSDFNIKEHPDFIEHNNKNYFIGSSALLGDKGLRIRDSEFMLENIPLFLIKTMKELNIDSNKVDILVLGTPFSEWKRLKDKIILKAEKFSDKIFCIPQAASASLIVTPKWNYALLLDIGYNTCDIVPIDSRGRIIADEGTSWEKTGISSILEDVDDLCKNVLGITLNSVDLENITAKPKLIKKIIKVSDDFLNSFENKIKTIIEEKFFYINAKLIDKYGNSFDKLILVGGGTLLFKNFFKKIYSKKIIIPKYSEFANVIGFLLYGLSQINFSGNILWEIFNKKNNKNDNVKSEEPENSREENKTDIVEE